MNLKLTKTAIRELTRLYRGVLVAAFIASAFVANGANATLTAADLEQIAAQITADPYTDGTYAASATYREDGESKVAVGTEPAVGQYQFILDNSDAENPVWGNLGDYGDGSHYNKGLVDVSGYQALSDATNGTLSGDATYNAAQIARNDTNLYTQGASGYKFSLADATANDPTVAAALGSTEGQAYFKYTSNVSGTPETVKLSTLLTSEALTLGENGLLVVDNLDQTAYTFALSSIDAAKGGRDASVTGTVAAGVSKEAYYYLTDSADPESKVYFADSTTLADLEANLDAVYVYEQYLADLHAYQGTDGNGGAKKVYEDDNDDYRTAIQNYNAERTAFNNLVDAYDNTETGYSKTYEDAATTYTALDGRYSDGATALSNDHDAWAIADAATDSIGYAVSQKAGQEINNALQDGGAIDAAIGNAITQEVSDRNDAITTALANGGDAYQTATDVGSAITTALANSGDAYQTASDVSTTVSTATTMTDDGDSSTALYHNFAEGSSVIAAIGSLDTAVDANTTAIGVLNGSGAGSVAKAVADEATARDTAIATATTMANDGDASTTLYHNFAEGSSVISAIGSLDTAVDANTSDIAILKGDASTVGSVDYAVAQEASARNTAIATATTMADDGDASTTLYHNFAEGSSVIAAIESIDTNMGKIHGLIGSDGSFNGTATSTNMDGTTYKGNLAVGTTVEDHLVALDNTIGIMSNLKTTEKTTVVGSINEVVDTIGTTTDGTYVAAGNTVGQNLNALDSALGDVRSDMASTQASNERRFAQIDRRIDKLEDKMEKGLAANNALAGLVPLDHTHTTQISAAMGGYGSSQALAIGAFHYLNDRTLLNAGVGYGGNSNMSYKVGVTFGF